MVFAPAANSIGWEVRGSSQISVKLNEDTRHKKSKTVDVCQTNNRKRISCNDYTGLLSRVEPRIDVKMSPQSPGKYKTSVVSNSMKTSIMTKDADTNTIFPGLPVGVTAVLSSNNGDQNETHCLISFDDKHIVKKSSTSDHQNITLLNQDVALIGRAKIVIVQGCVTIFGYTLSEGTKKSIMIESPSWMSALCIEPKYQENTSTIKNCSISERQVTSTIINNRIIKVKISSMSNDKLTFQLSARSGVKSSISISDRWLSSADNIIENVKRSRLFDNMITSFDFKKSTSSAENNKNSDLELSTHHKDIDFKISNSNRVLVCGAKGVGKSTYVRYLVNRLLTSRKGHETKETHVDDINLVAILDCDVGQPELSPPGMLSLTIVSRPLVCTPHAHMVCGASKYDSDKRIMKHSEDSHPFRVANEHESSFFFGHLSSKADPIGYIAAIKKLVERFEHVQKTLQSTGNVRKILPLIVNTDGWVKGMGYEILLSILQVTRPDHVVQILGSTKAKSFDLASQASPGKCFHIIESFGREDQSIPLFSNNDSPCAPNLMKRPLSSAPLHSTQDVPMASSLRRDFRLCTYFLGGYRSLVETGITFQSRGILDDDHVIANKIAGMRPYIVPLSSMRFVLPNHTDLTVFSEFGKNNRNSIYDIMNGSIVGLCQTDKDQTSIIDCPLPCVGIGLVRGIDQSRKVLFILTPVPQSLLQAEVNTLVIGQIKLPFQCLFRGIHSETFPFQCCDGLSIGIGCDVMKSKHKQNRIC